MSNKLLMQPDWWTHSSRSWQELSDFFSIGHLSVKTNWRHLAKGQSNYNYQFLYPDKGITKSYFVQIINSENQKLLPQVNQPPIIKRLTDYPWLNQWLVDCYLNTNRVRIFPWVNSLPITSETLAQPFLSMLGKFLIRLHSEKNTFNTHSQLPVIDIDSHLQRYRKLALENSPQSANQIDLYYRESKKLTRNFIASHLCHNDLSPNNILWNNISLELKIIDWEYACYSDVVMDIANLIINFGLNKQQEKNLIKLYSEQIGLKIPPLKLSKMKQLCQYISILWRLSSFKSN